MTEDQVKLFLRLKTWVRIIWWALLLGLGVYVLGERLDNATGAALSLFDSLLLLGVFALAMLPLVSEVSLFGFSLKKQIEELGAKVEAESEAMRSEVRAALTLNANIAPVFNLQSVADQRARLQEEVQTAQQQAVSPVSDAAGTAARPQWKHVMAEELSLRKIEAENDRPLARAVVVPAGDRAYPFDAVRMDAQRIQLIETKLLSGLERLPDTIRKVVDLVREVRTTAEDRRLRQAELLLVIVVDADRLEYSEARDAVRDAVFAQDVPISVRMFTLEELAQEFGVELAG